MVDLIFLDRKPGKVLSRTTNTFKLEVSPSAFALGQSIEVIWINTFKGICKFETSVDNLEGNILTLSIPANASKIQRRKTVRVDTKIPAKTSCFINTKIYNLKTPIEFYVLDLSESGMRIATDYDFKEKTNILFDLAISGFVLAITAEVVREIPSKDKKFPFNFGCNFTNISNPDVLRNYIFQIMREDLKRQNS